MIKQRMLKHLKTVSVGKHGYLRATICSLIVGAAVISLAPQGMSAMPPEVISDNNQIMTYEVYAGGINAVTAEMNVAYDTPKNYEVKFSARTHGFLGRVAPWNGTFSTKGWAIKDKKSMPEEHQSISVWRDEKEVKTYTYSKEGKFKDLTITEDGVDKSPSKLDDELVQNTTDALTATLEVMKKVASDKPCESNDEIFDGKRRFELVFSHQANEELKASKYNVYSGDSVRCVVEVQPIAGAWHKKPRGWMSIQEQGREKGTLPTVWFAKLDENGPAVPIKVRMKTNYGTFFMHLTGYKNKEKTLALK